MTAKFQGAMVWGKHMVLDIICPAQHQMRRVASRWRMTSPPHVPVTTGHTFLPMFVLLVDGSLDYFCAIGGDTGSAPTCQCHRYRRKVSQSVDGSLCPDSLHSCLLSPTSSWLSPHVGPLCSSIPQSFLRFCRAQSYVGRQNVRILSRSSGSPLYPIQWDFSSLGDEAAGIPLFSLLPGVLPGSLTPQIFRYKTKKDQLPYMFHPVLSADSDSAEVRRRRDGNKRLSMFTPAIVYHHRLRQWEMRRG